MPLELPNLPYSFDALEPHFDARTMEIHHGKHHAAYVAKGNAALEGSEWTDKSAEDVISNLSKLPDSIRSGARNNAGGQIKYTVSATFFHRLCTRLPLNASSQPAFHAKSPRACPTQLRRP